MEDGTDSNSAQYRIATVAIRSIETTWHVRLPRAFRDLYACYPQPYIAPCEFLPLDTISRGIGRRYGMLPHFFPFGRAVGEGALYGFYITNETALDSLPVIYFDEDETYYRPVASTFADFLKHCVLVGRYETEDSYAEAQAVGSLDEQREIGLRLNLDPDVVFGPLPRNDTELHERLAKSDPQDATSLCHLGCARRARGDMDRALDFFHRAVEAAPWFGDTSYLLADAYRVLGNTRRAIQCWWSVVNCALPLCTRTWEWNLGDEHPEAEIYEVAADVLSQHADTVTPEMKTTALWRVISNDDPYNPDVREHFADALVAAGDLNGAEREYLNALSLCSSEPGKQPDRLYRNLEDIYERTSRRRELAAIRFDRKLPRHTA